VKTTLNIIKSHRPCKPGWDELLNSLNKETPDDEPLDLMHILESNGIKDAVWTLRCFDYLDYCLFLADVAERALFIYETKGVSDAPRKAIQAIRDYKVGLITKDDLIYAADSVYDDADIAAFAAFAAVAAVYAVYDNDDVDDTVYAYAADSDTDAARQKKWEEIEALFIKHLWRGRMADITMCLNKKCPLKSECYRSTATPNDLFQSYDTYTPAEDNESCEGFLVDERRRFKYELNNNRKG